MLGGIALGTQVVSAEPSPDRYILDMRNTAEAVLGDVEVIHRLDAIDAAVVRGDRDTLTQARYARDMEFDLGEPEAAYSDEVVGVDDYANPLYYLQWDKEAQGVPDAHSYTRGEGTRVAVIDSGVYGDHPDLQDAINEDLSKNFTDDDADYNPNGASDHGTHVAGTIVADDGNGAGVVGTAPEAELVACRVFSASATTSFGDTVAAMVHAGETECDVANLSLGAYPLPKDNPFVAILIELMERAVEFATGKGTLMIASAGNDGANLDDDGDVISLPNEIDGVLSVAATGPVGFRWDDEDSRGYFNDDRKDIYDAVYDTWRPPETAAPYTNFGTNAIDISAPGGNFDQKAAENPNEEREWYYDLVLSTVFSTDGEDDAPSPGYGWKAGTSMAAPNVAGAAALIKSRYPDATPEEVRTALEATAADVGPEKYHGNGHLDVERAIHYML